MITYIALLRGINVGGKNLIPMAGLRAMAEKLGYQEPKTLLQSGNMVFSAEEKDPAVVERNLEAAIATHFGKEIKVLIRSAADWAAIIAANPFADETAADPSHLLVVPTREEVPAPRLADLRAMIEGREKIEAVGRTLYVVFPDGIGHSKVAGKFTDKNLGTHSTGRNWNTVIKLAALAGLPGV